MKEYYVQHRPQERCVEAWSAWRLPFDGLKPPQVAYRAELRRALGCLKANGALRAIYTSPQPVAGSDPDLENVLFYNVGTSAFRDTAKLILRFERRFGPVPHPPVEQDFVPRHHVSYQVSDCIEAAPIGSKIAEASVICREAHELKDLAGLWRAFKTAMTCPGNTLHKGPFALHLVISAREGQSFNLAEVVKPLADAFISALHAYEGRQLDAVVTRLSSRLECAPELVRDLLLQRRTAALGGRAVPHLRGAGLQWSPSDDLLVAGEVVRETTGAGAICIAGKAYAVEAATMIYPRLD
jgi:hypothetical protein